MEFPTIPKLQNEKRKWIENLAFFKSLVEENLDNSDIINSLNFNFLTKKWCKDNGKKFPLDFLIELKDILEIKYEFDATNLNISEDKKKKFIDYSIEIIQNIFIKYKVISNRTNIKNNFNKRYINGELLLENKDAFSDTPEVHYLNNDTFLADGVSRKIQEEMALSFWLNKSKAYLIEKDEIFKAIDTLGINDNFIIIAFNVTLKYHSSYLNINGLSIDSYKGTTILSFRGTRHVNQSFFILKKDDYPEFIYHELKETEIEKFSLEKRNNIFNIYTSILDLNQIHNLEKLKSESLRGHSEEKLKKSLLLSIAFQTEIRWKKDIELIQIIEYSKYTQKGLPDKLKDIVPFKKN